MKAEKKKKKMVFVLHDKYYDKKKWKRVKIKSIA